MTVISFDGHPPYISAKMKGLLRKYLVQQPTLFAWLAVLSVAGILVYLVLGIIATTQSAEGIMVFLFIFYLAGVVLLLLGGDLVLRKLFSGRLLWISIAELVLLTVFSFRYYYTRLYKMEMVVNHPTGLIVLVQDEERGVHIRKSVFQFRASLTVPANNIVFIDSSSFEILWYNLSIKSNTGINYTQFYPMQYSDRQAFRCGNSDYPVQFIQLEREGKRPPPMDDHVFDSVQSAVCLQLGRR